MRVFLIGFLYLYREGLFENFISPCRVPKSDMHTRDSVQPPDSVTVVKKQIAGFIPDKPQKSTDDATGHKIDLSVFQIL
ncbi:MAG: hypothetical protein PVI06_11525 [Desulfobacterales bacterium]|jgi:hypothetical protein